MRGRRANCARPNSADQMKVFTPSFIVVQKVLRRARPRLSH
jgi:hypothetical protein